MGAFHRFCKLYYKHKTDQKTVGTLNSVPNGTYALAMWRKLIFVALACVSSASLAASNEAEFSAEMLPRLQAAMPDVTLEPTPEDALAIKIVGSAVWGEATLNLHRIFGFCQQNTPADCEELKTNFISSISQAPQAPTADSLRLIVRDSGYLAEALSYGPNRDNAGNENLIYRPLGNELFAILASDSPSTIATVGGGVLSDLGLEHEAAWNRAMQQTLVGLPGVPTAAEISDEPITFEGGEYLASLLTDIDGWGRLSSQIGPDLFVAALSDQLLVVGTVSDGPELSELAQLMDEICASLERCVSPLVFRFRNGSWMAVRR